MAISITEAIKAATTGERAPCMIMVSRGSYQVRTFDERLGMYRVGNSMQYSRARACLTEARHAYALKALGWDNMDALCEAGDWRNEGSLRDRVKRSVAKAAT